MSCSSFYHLKNLALHMMDAQWMFGWDPCFSSWATLQAGETPTSEIELRDSLAGLSGLWPTWPIWPKFTLPSLRQQRKGKGCGVRYRKKEDFSFQDHISESHSSLLHVLLWCSCPWNSHTHSCMVVSSVAWQWEKILDC